MSIYKATSVVANTLKGETMAARSDTKLFFSGIGSTYDALADWAYPLLRITAGLMILTHVWTKFTTFGAAGVATSLARRGIEPALAFAYLIMFVELVGGICIAIGFLTRPFALLCLIEMIVIAVKAHLPNGWFFSVQGGGGEFPEIGRAHV